MPLSDDLKSEIYHIFADQWTLRDGQKVPETDDLKLGNDADKLEATVLYADLVASTDLVDRYKPHFAAEVYKAYLHTAAKVIRSEGGSITAYDGDRIMAVFVGDSKNTSSARAALKINYAVKYIINPAIKTQYPSHTYEINQIVGIDMSSLWVARTGIRGANDLVWVGKAANYAAKLCNLPDYSTWITEDVYSRLQDDAKFSNGKMMWDAKCWTAMDNKTIYCSNWWWKI